MCVCVCVCVRERETEREREREGGGFLTHVACVPKCVREFVRGDWCLCLCWTGRGVAVSSFVQRSVRANCTEQNLEELGEILVFVAVQKTTWFLHFPLNERASQETSCQAGETVKSPLNVVHTC